MEVLWNAFTPGARGVDGASDWGFKYGLTKASRPSRTTINQDFHVDRVLGGALTASSSVVFMSFFPDVPVRGLRPDRDRVEGDR